MEAQRMYVNSALKQTFKNNTMIKKIEINKKSIIKNITHGDTRRITK